MEFAISIYQGGERVYAKDCDFNSYSELALLCPECKQEVYLRKGKIRKPYFAHFRSTNPKQAKQCRLRVSSDEHAIETSEFIGYRGQRLEIFQQRFISMVFVGKERIVEDVEFKNWIDSIKLHNNQTINNITKDCTEYFINHQKEIVEIYCVHLKDEQPFLQQQIALKAIDYLCVQSSLQLLEYLLYYSVYKLYEHEQDNLFQQKLTTIDIVNICQYTAKVIMLNPWIEAVNNAKNTQLLANSYQFVKSKIVKNKSLLRLHTDIEAGSISDNEQDAIFWLKRVYLEWSEYYCLSEDRSDKLRKIIEAENDRKTRDQIIKRLRNSDRFKAFLTFTCYHQETKSFESFIDGCHKLGLLIVEYDDVFDGHIYKISPNWDTQSKIRMVTILRILKYSDRAIDINQDWIENKYLSNLTAICRSPKTIALDILSGDFTVNAENQILTSAINLQVENTFPTVSIGNIEYPLIQDFRIHEDTYTHKANYSVSTRVTNVKHKKQSINGTGTYREPRDRDGWTTLSQRVTSTEVAIVAMNSPKHRDCVLMYKTFQLEKNNMGILSHPEYLSKTLDAYNIKTDNVLGYIGIRYPSRMIDRLGIVYRHLRKDKKRIDPLTGRKKIFPQIWYADIIRFTESFDNSKGSDRVSIRTVEKLVRDDNGQLTRINATVTIPGEISTVKSNIDKDIKIFMSLYGISDRAAIKPAKLNTLNQEDKQININWSALLSMKVAPMNKEGIINWNPSYGCSYTII
ncbi:competence protein CoiA family protein [Nostoc sp.]|uniref:competence protein CoiA family protein n=1 Tax=Nostoc sp. TaxID=1180 RepID=UPI002FF44723